MGGPGFLFCGKVGFTLTETEELFLAGEEARGSRQQVSKAPALSWKWGGLAARKEGWESPQLWDFPRFRLIRRITSQPPPPGGDATWPGDIHGFHSLGF